MNQASRDRLFRVLRVASRWEIRQRKRVARWPARAFRWGFGIALGLFFAALGLGLSRALGVPAWFSDIGVFVLLLSYAAFLATSLATFLVPLWLYRRQIEEVIKNPIVVPLWNADITATVDAKFLSILMRHPLEDIEFVLLEVRAEREFFERRVSLIVGAVEKIGMLGLIPGWLAAWKWFQTLPNDPPSWVITLAYVIVIMYLLGWIAHFIMMRLDRMLKLLDLALVRKKAELKGPPNEAPSALA